MKYYIKGNYYFDIDQLNQLRIAGPQNHLLLGWTFPKNLELEVKRYSLSRGQLSISLEVPTDYLEVSVPLVTDIRTLRSFTESVNPRPTYNQLIEKGVAEVMPKKVEKTTTRLKTKFTFTNSYSESANQVNTYGAEISVPKSYAISLNRETITISGKAPLKITIKTITTVKIHHGLGKDLFRTPLTWDSSWYKPELKQLYEESKVQIEHLIRSHKTSSFEYGTIFPRDWIESADLGASDLKQKTVDYMYRQSMNYVSEQGEGWHEDVVGEYKTKLSDETVHIDRKMIDIEPRYILGLLRVSKRFLTNPDNHQKLKQVAGFILRNARDHDLITFKKVPNVEDQYQFVGNWRDSYLAFPRQRSPLAPYDVNCVFYPVALKTLLRYRQYFEVEEVAELKELIAKWDKNKSAFRLYHPHDLIGYSLALHGKKHIPLPIAHLDEAYDLFYGSPSLEEIVSFAKKLVDPEYFYTPVGPILVAADEVEFSTQQYHGKVIWPKQAAYAVAGLTKQFKRGLRESWPLPVMQVMKESIIKTSEACFKGWLDLGCVPELYYYDQETNKARFYTDQDEYEGQMSIIQLWSSIGARRIMHDYAFIRENTDE